MSVRVLAILALASALALPAAETDDLTVLGWTLPGGLEAGQVLRGRIGIAAPAQTGAQAAALTIHLRWQGSLAGSAAVHVPGPRPAWMPDQHWIDFALPIAEDLPAGGYELVAVPAAGQRIGGRASRAITLGARLRASPGGALAANGAGRRWQVVFPVPPADAGMLSVWMLGRDGLMRAAHAVPVAAGATRVAVELPEDGRWAAPGPGTLRFLAGGVALAAADAAVELPSSSATPAKPMAHGQRTRSDGVLECWHADDEHRLVWNGRPWAPAGGMFHIDLNKDFTGDAAVRRRQWEEERAALDVLAAHGFTDLYVNPSAGLTAPPWLMQAFADELNRRGLRFGWQLTVGALPIEAYRMHATRGQGLVRGTVTVPGRLDLRLPRLAVRELLLVPLAGGRARVLPFRADPRGAGGGMELIQVESAAGALPSDERSIEVPGLAVGDYRVLVRSAERGKRLTDLWGGMDETLRRLAWIEGIDWGPGLRFVVDPECNETGFNNHYEVLRLWSAEFNRDFAAWLERRYAGDIAALTRAWALAPGAVAGFPAAARLLPVRDREAPADADALTLVDGVDGTCLRTAGGLGESWLDYLQGVRELYAERRDAVARWIKQRVDVPVVIKRVSPWVSQEGINRIPGGVDGVGLELYAEGGSVAAVGGAPGRIEADLAAQTTWLLATELGHNARPGNGGVRGWPRQEDLRALVSDTRALGASGIFLFGWKLPRKEWGNMMLCDMPDRLPWVQEAFAAAAPAPWPMAVCYPAGQSWWFTAGKGEAWTRYTCVYDAPPSAIPQSLFLGRDAAGRERWAASSDVLPPGGDPLVVNLTDGLAAARHERDLEAALAAGRRLVYLGTWPATARVPSLARHFAGAPVRQADGSALQPLVLLPGDQALAASEAGQVWAKRSGRLLIVARTPIGPARRNVAEMPAWLKPAWLDQFMAGD